METHECEHKRNYDISTIQFCPAIVRLYDEHIPIKEKMKDFHELSVSIQNDPTIQNWNEPIQVLHTKLSAFMKELEPHANREDHVLIPLMAKHLGYDNKTLMVMEFEHGLAKDNLSAFMNGAEHIDEFADRNEAISLLTNLNVAYVTLSNHFLKEEKVLFPMAEELLSTDEKQELLEKMEQI